MDASRWLVGGAVSVLLTILVGLNSQSLRSEEPVGICMTSTWEISFEDVEWGPAGDDEIITGPTVYLSGPQCKPVKTMRSRQSDASLQAPGGQWLTPEEEIQEMQRAMELQKMQAAQEASKSQKNSKSTGSNSATAKSNASKAPARQVAAADHEAAQKASEETVEYASAAPVSVSSLTVTPYGVIW